MLVFRFQRGSLEDSMETVVKFQTEKELIDYIHNSAYWLKGTKITFGKEKRNDDRIGWKNVRYVLADGNAIGYVGEIK